MAAFWSDHHFVGTLEGRRPCYFNTGLMVMVMDLVRWRTKGYTKRIERWMEVQKSVRIYELGSLSPFLLVFAGHVGSSSTGGTSINWEVIMLREAAGTSTLAR
ncbi:hypothetical protein HN51_000635 [Arachis hypogaea]